MSMARIETVLTAGMMYVVVNLGSDRCAPTMHVTLLMLNNIYIFELQQNVL